MKHRTRAPRGAAVLTAALLTAGTLGATAPAHAAEPAVHLEGTLASGATYVLDVPAGWNGTLLLFSHGYRPAGAPNPAEDASDDTTRNLLLAEGYALAGSSYATTGWAAEQAVPDQLATLDTFTAKVGKARRTLAWGQSYGGLVTTALAERHPGRIDGSLSTCGLVQGGVANWNSTLDPVFAVKSLLAPGSDIPLTRLGDPAHARAAAQALTGVVTQAQRSATGRARIALAAALHNIPGWNDPAQTRPAPTDFPAQQANQYQALTGLIAMPAFAWRQEAEHRAGGSMSWNTGVDYTAMLRNSSDYREVKALYKSAGLSLAHDLATLDTAPRLRADPTAVAYLAENVAFTGRLRTPQLNIHTIGDALIPVQSESAYQRTAATAGTTGLLRHAYVDNAGHCTFTPAERIAALHTVERRITTGHWGDTGATALNAEARRIDPTSAARYRPFRPGPYPRPYDLARPTKAARTGRS
ncbi:alpha/beta hydrolase family protein [Streptomyces sp. NPDC058000]|uniref:alpha/beta hydrolase family protein n=1 Tax=Streptomyces sp. NPDC058000 TaxID=3346299 RepID=UPI0036E5F157